MAVISPFHLYNFGLNLQQLIDVQWPIKIFFDLKSFVRDRFMAMFILLSSSEGHMKLLYSGDHDDWRVSFIGFILKPYGDNLIDLYR